jgi:hypothetical protein
MLDKFEQLSKKNNFYLFIFRERYTVLFIQSPFFNIFFLMLIYRFAAKPIFSAHTNGSKHKYERFWRENEMIVMSMFAPIMYPPANVLVNFTVSLIRLFYSDFQS